MLDANELGDLVAVAHTGSLSGAAKRRGVAVSTIARRIDALEANLRLRLLDRRANGARLTPEGARIAELAAPLAEQIARVARAAEAMRTGATMAPVRISATEAVLSEILAPALPSLNAAFPVHLQSQPDIVSLAARDADIAVRMSRPEGASLIARKLGEMPGGWYAAQRWLGDRDPATVDLASSPLLMYDDSYGQLPEIDWVNSQGLSGAMVMRTGSTRALVAAALSGAGVAFLPQFLGGREPDLVLIASPLTLPLRTPWLIVHRDLRRLPHIRQTMRWLVATFDAALRRSGGVYSAG